MWPHFHNKFNLEIVYDYKSTNKTTPDGIKDNLNRPTAIHIHLVLFLLLAILSILHMVCFIKHPDQISNGMPMAKTSTILPMNKNNR